ncbi:MAG: hypothetical protein J5829_03660, partial [Lachnospiraceae bacterium]|nr:hypothetical protein [Lachnospiraceae bacterium]
AAPAAKKAAPAAKKAAPAAKKAAPAAKKAAPAAKKAAVKVDLTVQLNNKDYTKKDIEKAFEGVWTDRYNRKVSEVKSVNFYFKADEPAVYFVTDDGTDGRIDI